ncbi:hypothetical protein [Cellulomonas wangsupingiae]|uniref:hypothetical protein n=1 Tax=Cellulomonas wangsupingiae TaxID=2968085 RepID=UPI001D0E7232|nr:hypothetical protein [Cellulomonas wangsupingiae]MCM0641162.1 hypothetical protein [Cellulomonas wangsupingiae]
MPAAKPPEFGVEQWTWPAAASTRSRKIAADLGISESCLRRWMSQDHRYLPA